MATYIQTKVWRKKLLSNKSPDCICPVNYKWTCKRVKISLRGSCMWEIPDTQFQIDIGLEPSKKVFLGAKVFITPARPFK